MKLSRKVSGAFESLVLIRAPGHDQDVEIAAGSVLAAGHAAEDRDCDGVVAKSADDVSSNRGQQVALWLAGAIVLGAAAFWLTRRRRT